MLKRKIREDDVVDKNEMRFSQSKVGKKKKFDRRVWDKKLGTRFIGVGKTDSGKYDCKIFDPFKKKLIWVGTFNTPEQASNAYLTMKNEFEAAKGLQWVEVVSDEEHDRESETSDDLSRKSPLPKGKDALGSPYQTHTASELSQENVTSDSTHEPLSSPDKTQRQTALEPTHGSLDSPEQTQTASEPTHEPLDSPEQIQTQTQTAAEPTHEHSDSPSLTHESSQKPSVPSLMPMQTVSVRSRNFNGGGAMGFLIPNPNCSRNSSGSNFFLPVIDNYGFLLGEFSKIDSQTILDDWQ